MPSPTGYVRAHAASLCLPENRINLCRCGHAEEMHCEASTPTGSGCTHYLCDGCAEYEKASQEMEGITLEHRPGGAVLAWAFDTDGKHPEVKCHHWTDTSRGRCSDCAERATWFIPDAVADDFDDDAACDEHADWLRARVEGGVR